MKIFLTSDLFSRGAGAGRCEGGATEAEPEGEEGGSRGDGDGDRAAAPPVFFWGAARFCTL